MASSAPLHIIILAAGEGTRMNASEPKVMHEVSGKTMLARVLATARALRPHKIHVVVGAGADQVRKHAAGPGVVFHVQKKRLGTADAVQCALPGLGRSGTALVMHGDVIMVRASSLRKLCTLAAQGAYANLAMHAASPSGYGRIVRTASGSVAAIVAEKDATAAQRRIDECDAGPIAAPIAWLQQHLPAVRKRGRLGERMLPDLVAAACASGLPVKIHVVSENEAAGINSPAQKTAVEVQLGNAELARLAQRGTVFAQISSVSLRGSLRVGSGVFIDRNVLLEGTVALGNDVRIGPNCILRDCSLGAGTVVDAFTYIEGAKAGRNCEIGPYARVRAGSVLKDGARLGNFVEAKNTIMHPGATAKHLAYLGDAQLGEHANIGAGAVFCNYDGVSKHKSKVGRGTMIGAGSMLVAPIEIGDESLVAAGSVITKNVGDHSVAFGRALQKTRTRRGKAARKSKARKR